MILWLLEYIDIRKISGLFTGRKGGQRCCLQKLWDVFLLFSHLA